MFQFQLYESVLLIVILFENCLVVISINLLFEYLQTILLDNKLIFYIFGLLLEIHLNHVKLCCST